MVRMQNSLSVIEQMDRELARDIAAEVKEINKRLTSGELTQAQIKGQLARKKEMNQERIKRLGLTLIIGGKEA